jgi:hypothetical protein
VCFDDQVWVRGLAAAVLFVLALFLGASVAAAMYTMRDPGYSCIANSPAFRENDLPQGTHVVKASGEFSRFPLGVRCMLTANDGSTALTEPGWLLTVFGGASITAFVAALVTVGCATRARAHSVRGVAG